MKKNCFFFILVLISSLLIGQTTEFTGYCSYYADKFQGRNTASGDAYDKNALTAAHRTLPFNTILEVTNLRNNKKIWVRVNDRGPHIKNRILDVSKAAAYHLDMIAYGVEKVSFKILDSVTSALILDTLTKYSLTNKPLNNYNKPPPTTLPSLKDSNTYDKDLKLVFPSGYGVQVGYYKSKTHAVAAVKNYQEMYQTKSFMFVEKKTDGHYYRVILGDYTSHSEADVLRKKVIQKIVGCTVIHWKKL